MEKRIKFGYNVQRLQDPVAFADHYKKAKLGGSLFYAGNTDLEYVAKLTDDNPGSLNVIRNWPDADQHRRMTPQQWMDSYANQSHSKRLIIGASNESEWTPQFLAWTLELCKLAVRNDVRICVINLNTGHNTPVEWAQAKEILQVACDNPDLIYIGLHEYAGGIITSGFVGGNPDGTITTNAGFQRHPGLVDMTKRENWPTPEQLSEMTQWHCGRFNFLNKYCMDTFGKLPSIIITEHGFDYLSDIGSWLNSLPRRTSSINGWKTLGDYWNVVFPGMSREDALWMQLEWADTHIYAADNIKVKILFDYGPNPDWELYRVDGAIENKLEAYAMANTGFTIKVDNFTGVINIPDGKKLNFRPEPNTSKPAIGTLNTGNVVKVLSWYLQPNNNWCRINFNGVEGYVSLLTNSVGVDTVTFKIVPDVTPIPDPVPVPVPTPVPDPKPETNFDAARAEIAKAIQALQSLLLLLPATKQP